MKFVRLTSILTSLTHYLEAKRALLPALTLISIGSSTLLLYQNCAPAPQAESSSSASRTGVYSSTIGGYTGGGTSGAGGGAMPGAVVPGGVTPTDGSGGTAPGSTTPGAPGGTMPGGTIPVDGGGTGGNGGTGVQPGGGTGGATTSLVWQYQPDDLTLEEGGALTLSAYATKGYEGVTYQWYKNGTAISGATSYLYRQFLIPRSAAGQYYVIAKSGADTIRSYSVTIKVRAARAPCAAGFYGPYPGSGKFEVYWHESTIGRTNAKIELKEEVEDAYITEMPYEYYYNNPVIFFPCKELYQCRNGKFYLLKKLCPNPDTGGGG
ncbi:MAG: hypothetical protein IPJ84_21265 [Bdellovibrionales bacterium]|nr:hypothetical protein [Bdellovibrionales bacterium]